MTSLRPTEPAQLPHPRADLPAQDTSGCCKIVAISLLVATLAAAIPNANYGNTREACLDWNHKINLVDHNADEALAVGVKDEDFRNTKLDEAQAAIKGERVKKQDLDLCDERHMYSLSSIYSSYSSRVDCSKKSDAYIKAKEKSLKAQRVFDDSDKKYKQSTQRHSDLRNKVTHLHAQKPFFCGRHR